MLKDPFFLFTKKKLEPHFTLHNQKTIKSIDYRYMWQREEEKLKRREEIMKEQWLWSCLVENRETARDWGKHLSWVANINLYDITPSLKFRKTKYQSFQVRNDIFNPYIYNN